MTEPVNPEAQPTDETVRMVWEGMVEADRLSRYYGYLAHRLKRLSELLQVAAVVLGALALSSIFYRLPGWIAFSAANFAALAFALSTIRGYSAKAELKVHRLKAMDLQSATRCVTARITSSWARFAAERRRTCCKPSTPATADR